MPPHLPEKRYPREADPADVVVAWEAVEELLAAVPEGDSKTVLRMIAAGLDAQEIARHMGVAAEDVGVLAARGRIRVLSAAIGARRQVSDATEQ